MARWRRLLSYAVVFAVGVGGGAGVARWFRPPTRSIDFEVQVDYFLSSQPIEGLRAKFIRGVDGGKEVELESELDPHFIARGWATAKSKHTLPDNSYTATLRALRRDNPVVELARPNSFEVIRIDLFAETSKQSVRNVIQLREREYRIISVKSMPNPFQDMPWLSESFAEHVGEPGYLVISTSRFRRTP